jgi:RNase P subunit RPR2
MATTPLNTSYVSHIFCAKCKQGLWLGSGVKRRFDGKKRWIEVSCHGQTERVEFASVPDKKVSLWESEPAKS